MSATLEIALTLTYLPELSLNDSETGEICHAAGGLVSESIGLHYTDR